MKHIKLLPLLLILLCACSSNTTTLTVNDPLSYSVRIKDNAEFILVKEGTSIEDFNDILLDNLDITTNADTYDVDWYGEALSSITRKDYEMGLYIDKGVEEKLDETEVKEYTLNHDSIRPIELIIDFTKDGQTETYYKQILLCVARDTEYDLLFNNTNGTIENLYQILYPTINSVSYTQGDSNWINDGYISNIRGYGE